MEQKTFSPPWLNDHIFEGREGYVQKQLQTKVLAALQEYKAIRMIKNRQFYCESIERLKDSMRTFVSENAGGEVWTESTGEAGGLRFSGLQGS